VNKIIISLTGLILTTAAVITVVFVKYQKHTVVGYGRPVKIFYDPFFNIEEDVFSLNPKTAVLRELPVDLAGIRQRRSLMPGTEFLCEIDFHIDKSIPLTDKRLILYGSDIPNGLFYLNFKSVRQGRFKDRVNLPTHLLRPGGNTLHFHFTGDTGTRKLMFRARLRPVEKTKSMIDFGPYIRRRTYTSLKISWLSSRRSYGYLFYAPMKQNDWLRTTVLVSRRNNTAFLSKLQEGTRYRYRVHIDRTPKNNIPGVFTLPSPKKERRDTMSFVVVGDAVRDTQVRKKLIKQLQTDPGVRFVVYTGNRRAFPEDHHWRYYYFKGLTPLYRQNVFYPAKGPTKQSGFYGIPFNHKDGYYKVHNKETVFDYQVIVLNINHPLTLHSDQYRWLTRVINKDDEIYSIIVLNGHAKRLHERYPHLFRFMKNNSVNMLACGGVGTGGVYRQGSIVVTDLSLPEKKNAPGFIIVKIDSHGKRQWVRVSAAGQKKTLRVATADL
jgi:hypothetical protein